ncbi:hypothetical protein A3218_05660 [Pseudomonas chlororaphis]|uniref:contractile injection system tape measure protein n=1 Tax=Pseudomonas chlororaphis TaxID=587753 RepID=UPI000789F03A|nr:contractile injection system tape measure protein [Pseudomonas chlororaphis]AMS13805.1 hypothetical protein A3218_05660 [Pseudomonas chlororaphis]
MDIANPLLDRCRRLFHQQCRQDLATLLEQIGQTGEGAVEVSSIVLDLGEIPLTQFDDQFGRHLLSALAARLRPLMVKHEGGLRREDGVALPTCPSQTGSEGGKRVTDQRVSLQTRTREPGRETTLSLAATLRSQLATFLNHGLAGRALSECLASRSDDWLVLHLYTDPASWRRVLSRSVLRFGATVRLLQSLGEAGLGEACVLLYERSGPWPAQDKSAGAFSLILGALLAQARQASSQIPEPESARFMQLLGSLELPREVLPFLADAVVELSNCLPSPALLRWLRLLCLESGQWPHLAPFIGQAQRHRLRALLLEEQPSPSKNGQGDKAPKTSEPCENQDGSGLSNRSGQQASAPGSSSRHLPTSEASEPWLVSNAGLVLLWPLLPGLFSRLDLQKQGQFIDRQAQCRAVCWLDEWLWGDGAQAQWRTPLTQLLCGLPLDTPLLPWAELGVEARAGLDELLQALLAQTPALARCSSDEVRRWFLQRPGWLSWQKGQWRLEVEDDACDVLLIDLPWSKNQVPFAWLESPLNIVWP